MRTLYWVMFFIACVFNHAGFAAIPANPLDIESARQEAKDIEKQVQQKLKEAPRPQGVEIPEALLELVPVGECQLIKKIWLYGADALSDTKKEDITAPYIDRCADNQDITDITNAVQRWYLDNGYITTRVSIKNPQNSLDKGNLEIWVVEGRLGKFSLGENTRFDKWRIKSAFPLRHGEVINISELDHGLEQLNRLSSQKFHMQIKPSQIPAFSDVILIENAQSELGLYLYAPSRHAGRQLINYQYNNSGTQDTGEHLHNISFTRENLIGLNESFTLSHQRNIPLIRGEHQNESDSFGFNLPWGYWYFKANYSHNRTARKVATENATFFSKGDSQSSSVAANRLLSRSKHRKTELVSGLKYSDRKNYINDTLVEISSRRVSSLDLGLTHTHYFSSATLICSLNGVRGMHWFGTLEDPPGIPENAPTAQYTLYKLFAFYQQNLFQLTPYRFSFQSTLNAQYTTDVLYGENHFVIGGQYSVRGFNDNILSNDGGWTLRNDLILPVGLWAQAWQNNRWILPLTVKLFYDAGRGRPADGGKDDLMSGWGFGVNYNYRWFEISLQRATAIKSSGVFASDEGWLSYVSTGVNINF